MRRTTHYRDEMVDAECEFCTEYSKERGGCTRKSCPWPAERTEGGADQPEEEPPHGPRRRARLCKAVRPFRGSLRLDKDHRRRMEALRRSGRDAPAFCAALYLLTSDPDTAKRTAGCFRGDDIRFSGAAARGISPHGYALLSAARDIYAGGDGISLRDLADGEIIDMEAFCLIVNALVIARYGSEVLEPRKKRGS